MFSNTSDVVFRTELIVMITPKVVVDESAMRLLNDELRNKMKKPFEYGNSVESIEF